MLSIILKILSILGIILLVLLGVVLLALLLILFYPICYRVKASRQPLTSDRQESFVPGEEFENRVNAKAWWLLGLLRILYQYPDPGVIRIKLLFFTIYDSGKTDSLKGDAKEDEEDWMEGFDSEDNSSERSTISKENPVSQQTAPNTDSDTEMQDDLDAIASESRKKSVFAKIKYTIESICDKIKSIFGKMKHFCENLDELCEKISYYKEILTEEDTKGLLQHAFLRTGQILKSIRPRKLRADILFGASSPDITGYVCAGYGMLCPHLGSWQICFTPDFERAVLQGNFYAAGHITIYKILWNGLMIVKDKRLWALKDKLTKPDKSKHSSDRQDAPKNT